MVPTLDRGRSTWGCDLPRNRLLDLVVLNAWASWLIFRLGVVSGWLLLGVHGGNTAIGCHHGGHEVVEVALASQLKSTRSFSLDVRVALSENNLLARLAEPRDR